MAEIADKKDRRNLYNNLQGSYDLGTFEQFNAEMDDDANVRYLYDALSQDEDTDWSLPDYESFYSRIGKGKAQAQPNVATPKVNAGVQMQQGAESMQPKTVAQSVRSAGGKIQTQVAGERMPNANFMKYANSGVKAEVPNVQLGGSMKEGQVNMGYQMNPAYAAALGEYREAQKKVEAERKQQEAANAERDSMMAGGDTVGDTISDVEKDKVLLDAAKGDEQAEQMFKKQKHYDVNEVHKMMEDNPVHYHMGMMPESFVEAVKRQNSTKNASDAAILTMWLNQTPEQQNVYESKDTLREKDAKLKGIRERANKKFGEEIESFKESHRFTPNDRLQNTSAFMNMDARSNSAATLRALDKAEQIRQAYMDNKSTDGTWDEETLGFFGGSLRGFRDGVFDINSWTSALELGKSINLMKIAEKAEKDPESLTQEENDLLDAVGYEMATEVALADELGWGYKSGQTTGMSLPFMIDLMLGGNLSDAAASKVGNVVTRQLTKRIASKGFYKTAKTWMGKKAAQMAENAVVKKVAGVGEKIADKTVKRLGNKVIQVRIPDQVIDTKLGKVVGDKFVGKTLGDLTEKALTRSLKEVPYGMAQALVFSPAKIASDAINKHTGNELQVDRALQFVPEGTSLEIDEGEDWLTSIATSLISNTSEYWSEKLGDKVLEPFTRVLGDSAKHLFGTAMKNYFPDVMNGAIAQKAGSALKALHTIGMNDKWSQYVRAGAKAVHQNGLFNEYLEEVANNITNAMIGEMEWGDVVDLKKNAETVLGLAWTSGAFAMAGTGTRVKAYTQAKHRLDNAFKAGIIQTQDDGRFRAFAESLKGCTFDEIADKYVQFKESIKDDVYANELAGDALRYARAYADLMGVTAVDNSDGKKQTEGEQAVDEAQGEGMNATSPEEKVRIYNELADARTKLQEAIGSEDVDAWLSGFGATSAEQMENIQFDENLTDDQKGLATAYVMGVEKATGAQEIQQAEVDAKVKDMRKGIEQITNEDSGMIEPVMLTTGERGNIVKGNLEAGDTVMVRMEDGSTKMVGKGQIQVTEDAMDAEALMAETEEKLRTSEDARFEAEMAAAIEQMADEEAQETEQAQSGMTASEGAENVAGEGTEGGSNGTSYSVAGEGAEGTQPGTSAGSETTAGRKRYQDMTEEEQAQVRAENIAWNNSIDVKDEAEKTGMSEKELKRTIRLANSLGMKVVIEDITMTGEWGSTQTNGDVLASERVIHLSRLQMLRGTAVEFTVGHELTHQIKADADKNPQVWDSYVDAIVGMIGQEKFTARLLSTIGKYKGVYKGMNREQFMDKMVEEVAADCAGELFMNGENLDKVAGTPKSVVDKIVEFLRELIFGKNVQDPKVANALAAWTTLRDSAGSVGIDRDAEGNPIYVGNVEGTLYEMNQLDTDWERDEFLDINTKESVAAEEAAAEKVRALMDSRPKVGRSLDEYKRAKAKYTEELKAAQDELAVAKEATAHWQAVYDRVHGENKNDAPATEQNDRSYSVAGDKTLYGVHNLTEEGLRHALKMGGLANPSTAVVDMNVAPMKNFGGISLIMPKDMVAKKSGKNAGTWSSDAYTPRYPRNSIAYNVPDKGRKKLSKLMHEVGGSGSMLLSGISDRGMDAVKDNIDVKRMFLKSKGINADVFMTGQYSKDVVDIINKYAYGPEDEYGRKYIDRNMWTEEQTQKIAEAYRSQWTDEEKWQKHLFYTLKKLQPKEGAPDWVVEDYAKMREFVQKYGDTAVELEDFATNVMRDARSVGELDKYKTVRAADQAIADNGLKDEFAKYAENLYNELGVKEELFNGYTPSGNRKYLAHTLANVSKMMKKAVREGGESGFGTSPGALRAKVSPVFSTLEQMRKNKGRLTTKEKMEEIKNQINEECFELESLLEGNMSGDEGFYRLEEAMLHGAEWVNRRYRDIDLDEEDIARIETFRELLKTAPTEYFETKFERPVGIEEFAAAVVPDNLPKDLVDTLAEKGLNIVKYDGNDVNDRERAVKEFVNGRDDIMYSVAENANEAALKLNNEEQNQEYWSRMAAMQNGYNQQPFGKDGSVRIEGDVTEKQIRDRMERMGKKSLSASQVRDAAKNGDMLASGAVNRDNVHAFLYGAAARLNKKSRYPFTYDGIKWGMPDLNDATVEKVKEHIKAVDEFIDYVNSVRNTTASTDPAERVLRQAVLNAIGSKEYYKRWLENDPSVAKMQLPMYSVADTSEEQEILGKAKAGGFRGKSPNGAVSNLNRKQWSRVRTQKFKNFFGDFETAKLAELAGKVWSGKREHFTYNFTPNQKAKKELSAILGHDVNAIRIDDSTCQHIKNRHGSNQSAIGQVDVLPMDIVLLPYIINNADIYTPNSEHDTKQGRAVTIVKRLNGVAVVGSIELGKDKVAVVTNFEVQDMETLKQKIKSGSAPGLYVLNASNTQLLDALDAKHIAKVQKDIQKIKDNVEKVSKVVDENGEPLVVYHGAGLRSRSKEPFTVFEDNGDGLFFTDNKAVADYFAPSGAVYRGSYLDLLDKANTIDDLVKIIADADNYKNAPRLKEFNGHYVLDYGFTQTDLWNVPEKGKKYISFEDKKAHGYAKTKDEIFNSLYTIAEEKASEIDYGKYRNNYSGYKQWQAQYKCYLDIKNPLEIDANGSGFYNITLNREEGYTATDIAQYARENGYDGVIIRNIGETPREIKSTDYIVFNPEQIKSATDNNGNYDRSNPDIRYSIAGENEGENPFEAPEMMEGENVIDHAARISEWMKNNPVAKNRGLSKAWRQASKLVKGNTEYTKVLNDLVPHNINEVASVVLGALDDRTLKSIIGVRGDRFLRERLGEEVMFRAQDEFGVSVDEFDAMAGVNAVEEVLAGADTPKDIRNYIQVNRIMEVQGLLENDEAQLAELRDSQYMDEYGMTYDEYQRMREQDDIEMAEIDQKPAGVVEFLKGGKVRLGGMIRSIRKELEKMRKAGANAETIANAERELASLESMMRQTQDGLNAAISGLKQTWGNLDNYRKVLNNWKQKRQQWKEVRDIINSIDKKSVSHMDKRTLNSIMKLVGESGVTEIEDMAEVVAEAKSLATRIENRALVAEVEELLKRKTTKVDPKGMKVGAGVDSRTQGILENMRKTRKEITASGLEDEIHQLRSENWHIRFDNVGAELTDEQKQRIADNNARVAELQQQAKSILDNKATDTAEDIASKIENRERELNEKTDAATSSENAAEELKKLEPLEDEIEALKLNKRMVQAIDAERDALNAASNARELQKRMDELGRMHTNGEIGDSDYKTQRQNLMNAYKGELDAQRQAEADMNDKLKDFRDALSGVIEEGRQKHAKTVQMRQAEKHEMIAQTMRGLKGTGKRPLGVNNTNPKKRQEAGKIARWKKYVSPAMDSFEYMAQQMSQTSMGKDGYFYQAFIMGDDGVMAASDNYVTGLREAQRRMDEICRDIFGKSMQDVMKENNELVENTDIWVLADPKNEASGMVEQPMTKAQALYTWMLWKMPDGRVKLRKGNGFTDESMEQVGRFIGEDMKQWAEVIQEEYLPELRERYNEVYRELYDTNMANIEHYMPIRIDQDSIHQDIDLASGAGTAASVTVNNGALIERKRNANPIDLKTSAFEILLEHVDKMEDFRAYGKVRRNLSWILSSKAVENQMNANNHGSFQRMLEAAQIAVKADKHAFKLWVEASNGIAALQKGLVGGNIAFRTGTALKQMLSAPAFLGYSQNPKYLAILTGNILGQYLRNAPGIVLSHASLGFAFDAMLRQSGSEVANNIFGKALSENMAWCMENVPDFYKRVMQDVMGDPRLSENLDSKYDKALNAFNKKGMATNKLVDAITVSIGIKSIFDYKMPMEIDRIQKEAARMAFDSEAARQRYINEETAKARRHVIREAEIYYNQTQQSNHPAFLSSMQTSRDFLSRCFTLYKNSPIGYARKLAGSIKDLRKFMDEDQRYAMKEYYWNQIMEKNPGMDEDEAWDEAGELMFREARKRMFDAILYGVVMNAVWNAGGALFISLFGAGGGDGDDPEEEELNPAAEAVLFGLNTVGVGVPYADMVAGTANAAVGISYGRPVEFGLFSTELNDLAKDIRKGNDLCSDGMYMQAMMMVMDRASKFSGFSLETMKNMTLGTYEMLADGWNPDVKRIDMMYILNLPKSQRREVGKRLFAQVDENGKPVYSWDDYFEAMKYANNVTMNDPTGRLTKEWERVYDWADASEEEREAWKQWKAFEEATNKCKTVEDAERLYNEAKTQQQKDKAEARMKKLLNETDGNGEGHKNSIAKAVKADEAPVTGSEFYEAYKNPDDIKEDIQLAEIKKRIERYKAAEQAFVDSLNKQKLGILEYAGALSKWEAEHKAEANEARRLNKYLGERKNLLGKMAETPKKMNEYMESLREERKKVLNH